MMIQTEGLLSTLDIAKFELCYAEASVGCCSMYDRQY